MYKKYADKWVKALRSGNYQQGKGALCKDNNFCCLGVLCDVIKDDFDIKEISSPHGIRYSFEDSESNFCIPIDLVPKLGLKSTDPSVPTPETVHSNYYRNFDGKIGLSTLNDNLEFDFNKIADLVEKHYKEI